MIDQRYRTLAGAAEEAAHPPEFASVRRRAGRLRARRRAGGVLAAVVLVAAGVAGAAVLRPADQTWEPAGSGGRILAADAADANHLYAIRRECDSCPPELIGSTDGGQSWTERSRLENTDDSPLLRVLSPKVALLSWTSSTNSSGAPVGGEPGAGDPAAGARTYETRITVDGGRTWRVPRTSAKPVSAAAKNMRVLDSMNPGVGPFTSEASQLPVFAVDPASGQIAPLANQPPLRYRDVVDVPREAGLWVTGADPATDKPAISVSRDGGRTWKTTVFSAENPAVQRHGGESAMVGISPPQMATSDGQLAYATMPTNGAVAPDGGPGRWVRPGIYRTTDGGAHWNRAGDLSMPAPLLGAHSVVIADGTHVLAATDGKGYQFLGSPDGRKYTRIDLGLRPAPGEEPRAVAARLFLFRSAGVLYTSADGRSWRAVAGD
ncbi:WD40/YVTN/BNR-like repeat-containing protein [Phytohabitans sp. LJ34]|uniref:WD40/YVTN/BNR-like repeat-containing protein n=1 Tax=Phytohabitans sp. LJ34 TaxID=3452217 RepID=UPI003F88D00E